MVTYVNQVFAASQQSLPTELRAAQESGNFFQLLEVATFAKDPEQNEQEIKALTENVGVDLVVTTSNRERSCVKKSPSSTGRRPEKSALGSTTTRRRGRGC